MEQFSGIILPVLIGGFLYALIIDAETYAPAILVMSIICGLIAFITDHFVLAVCYICLSVFANDSMKKHPNGKDGQMKDSTLDRVKFAKIHFYDRSVHTSYDWKSDVMHARINGDDMFWVYSRLMVDPMMEKESVVLLDDQEQVIPIDQYSYSWDERPDDYGDGGAWLHLRRIKAS